MSQHGEHLDDLTHKEQEILCLLAEGLTNRRIADALSITQSTVETHLHHIYQKLSAKNRTQAAKWYRDHT